MTDRIDERQLLGDPDPRAHRLLRLFWVGILVTYVVILAIALPRVGDEDHDQQLVFHEIRSWNHEYFGLDRQWTPVMAGGMSAAGDPQIPVLSLGAMAGELLGPFWGMRLVSMLWFVVGFVAAFLYAGLWLRGREVRAMAAALFIGNGFFVCHYAYGHIPFQPFLAFPLLLWLLHRIPPWACDVQGGRRAARWCLAALGLGSLLAIQVDGAAQVLVYMFPWIGIYALGLGLARRSIAPVLLFGAAVVVTALLDAAFLWSLVDSQQITQRLQPGQFTNPIAMLLFALLPFRGMFPTFPTPQNGYELTVFVGVVVAFAIVRYGRRLVAHMPREVRIPLLLTAGLSALFGLGSLAAVGVPWFLSPYDLLRELPGFRSIVVTGRFWGFLALPLSLVGAAALWRLACQYQRRPPVLAALLLTAVGLQLGFQGATLGAKLLRGRTHEPVPTEGLFESADGEQMSYVFAGDGRLQGLYITPTTGVIDAFNLIDFIRPPMEEGKRMVVRASVDGRPLDRDAFEGRFLTWSRIRLTLKAPWPLDPTAADTTPVRLVLNQAWHPYWSAEAGRVERTEPGNLVAVVTRRDLEAGRAVLRFHDRVSERGTRVSLIAWPVALGLMLILGLYARRPRSERAG